MDVAFPFLSSSPSLACSLVKFSYAWVCAVTKNSKKLTNAASLGQLRHWLKKGGFTLIEMLIVVAVIGVMTSLVIAAITNSSADAKLVIARQQQATIQEALNAWIASTNSAAARSLYQSNTTGTQKITLIRKYLDTNARWMTTGLTYTDDGLQTDNMKAVNVKLAFGTWAQGSYPVVTLQQQ